MEDKKKEIAKLTAEIEELNKNLKEQESSNKKRLQEIDNKKTNESKRIQILVVVLLFVAALLLIFLIITSFINNWEKIWNVIKTVLIIAVVVSLIYGYSMYTEEK